MWDVNGILVLEHGGRQRATMSHSREETKTSRLGLRLHRSCDAAGCQLAFFSSRWSGLPPSLD